MTNDINFIEKLEQLDRIQISEINSNSKILLQLSFLFSLTLYSSIAFYFSSSYLWISIFSFPIFVVFYYIRSVYNTYSSAFIKGDCLILTNTLNQNSVAPLGSIREVKSQKVGNKTITFIRYKLDGLKYKVVLISNAEIELQPLVAIKLAKNHFKNKRQIYKPGSVF